MVELTDADVVAPNGRTGSEILAAIPELFQTTLDWDLSNSSVQVEIEGASGQSSTLNLTFTLPPAPTFHFEERVVASGQGVEVICDDYVKTTFFKFDVFPGRSKLAVLNGGAWAVERVVWNPFPRTEHNDYVLLILEDDIERGGQYGRLGLCAPSSSTLDELPVVTAGYPAAAYKCGQTPDPPDGDNDCPCGGWMYTQTCEISDVDPQELTHTCLSQDGQSGSPLWVDECISNSTRCTVGIHYGKSGLSSAAVRWEDNDIEWLHTNICQWPSDYAALPPFCY